MYLGVSHDTVVSMTKNLNQPEPSSGQSWIKLDTAILDSEKLLKLEETDPGACWIWLKSITLAFRRDTDGYIGEVQAKRTLFASPEQIRLLVDSGLWEQTKGGYLVHDYLSHQMSAEEREKRREKRRAAGRKGGRPRKSQDETESKPTGLPESATTKKQGVNQCAKHVANQGANQMLSTLPSREREREKEILIPLIVPQNSQSVNSVPDDGRTAEAFREFRRMWPKKGGSVSSVQTAFNDAARKVGLDVLMQSARSYLIREQNNENYRYVKHAANWLSDDSCIGDSPAKAVRSADDRSEAGLARWLEEHPEFDYIAAKRLYFGVRQTHAEAIDKLNQENATRRSRALGS
jgi:hypothetical protein